MPVVIRSDQVRRWLGADDPFKKIKSIHGQVVRSKEGRTTQRFEIEHKGYYVKLHEGVGWWEIAKNLLQLRMPVIGASNEWNAINRLHELGVCTMDAVAFGKKGQNPAAQKSFVVTEELTHTLDLDKYCESWLENKPSVKLKRGIINQVATIARTLHEHGINHRDLYLCHFLLDVSSGVEKLDAENLRLYLIDLHRVGIRSTVPERWLVKDLASIYFSSLDVGFSRRDVYRFVKAYTGLSLKQALIEKKLFWKKVRRRAHKLYLRDRGQMPKDWFE